MTTTLIGQRDGNAWFPPEEGRSRECPEAETPVGEACGSCEEPIEAGHWGSMIPHVMNDGVAIRPVHGECVFRDVMGGIEHLTAPPGHASGSCYEGSTLTRRESALAAYAWIRTFARVGRTGWVDVEPADADRGPR